MFAGSIIWIGWQCAKNTLNELDFTGLIIESNEKNMAKKKLQKNNKRIKKGLVGALFAAMLTTLTGCSLLSYKPSVATVEKVCQECINQSIKSSNKVIKKEKDSAGIGYVYSMVDERGIEFEVKLHNSYVTIVEPIPPFFSGNRTFYNDYATKVIQYYEDDIDDILKRESVEDYNLNGGVNVDFKQGTDYEEIARVIMDIDELLAIDYKCGGVTQTKPNSDTKTFWDGFGKANIRVKIKADSLFKVFTFSGNNDSLLSYEDVLEELQK